MNQDHGPLKASFHAVLGVTGLMMVTFLGAKCDGGCRRGGVCTAVKYDCICSRGFYKKGDQCLEGK